MSFDTSVQKTKAMRRAEPYGSALNFLMSLDRNPRRASPSLMTILFFSTTYAKSTGHEMKAEGLNLDTANAQAGLITHVGEYPCFDVRN